MVDAALDEAAGVAAQAAVGGAEAQDAVGGAEAQGAVAGVAAQAAVAVEEAQGAVGVAEALDAVAVSVVPDVVADVVALVWDRPLRRDLVRHPVHEALTASVVPVDSCPYFCLCLCYRL